MKPPETAVIPANQQLRPKVFAQNTMLFPQGLRDAIPTTQQTFRDVPVSNPFWLYVERAYTHGVISGYTTSPPCTTGTPCFLATTNVTRGQTAKFVAQAGGVGWLCRGC